MPDRVLLIRLRVKLPVVDGLIETGGDEASVILEPSDGANVTIVGLEVVVRRVVRGIEVKDLDVLDVLTGEEVATVGEHDLTALLDV